MPLMKSQNDCLDLETQPCQCHLIQGSESNNKDADDRPLPTAIGFLRRLIVILSDQAAFVAVHLLLQACFPNAGVPWNIIFYIQTVYGELTVRSHSFYCSFSSFSRLSKPAADTVKTGLMLLCVSFIVHCVVWDRIPEEYRWPVSRFVMLFSNAYFLATYYRIYLVGWDHPVVELSVDVCRIFISVCRLFVSLCQLLILVCWLCVFWLYMLVCRLFIPA